MKAVLRLFAVGFLSISFFGYVEPIASIAASGSAQTDPGDSAPAQVEAAPGDDWVWTDWRPGQYALADDGESIWVGTAMGLLRWDKAASSYERITRFEGFPQNQVYAVIVDAAGNRWFGGDGGLSRLDNQNRWTHFTTANSGLHSDFVDGIAVAVDGTVWTSHGLPDGAVSRLAPDGTWRQFPNRSAAIIEDYADILTTRNLNPLWLVADDEIWMGYWVYDGHDWTDRLPGADYTRARSADGTPRSLHPEPLALDKDSAARVWALVNAGEVQRWSSGGWTVQSPYMCGVSFTTLNVGPDDRVWIGYLFSEDSPFGIYQCSGITTLPPLTPICPLSYPCEGGIGYEPPTATYVSSEGIWSVGPDWLRQSNGQVANIEVHPDVTHLLMHPDGKLWMRLDSSAIQTFEDQASGQLNDDLTNTIGWFSQLDGWAALPNGDVFITWWQDGYHGPFPRPPMRWVQGQWIQYDPPLPSGWFTDDVFVQDYQHIWFSAFSYFADSAAAVSLDDNNTPTDLTDDTWNVFYAGEVFPSSVAVDTIGRVWLGSYSGLYLQTDDSWQRVVEDKEVCELVPTDDGMLLALLCGDSLNVIIIDQAGYQTLSHVYTLARENLDILRSATRPNQKWAIAPDGGVWVVDREWPTDKLRRYDEAGYQEYDPSVDHITNVIAGPDNRVWFTADGILWRLSPKPDFDLSPIQGVWPTTPDSEVSYRFPLRAVDGFNLPVTLEAAGLPPEITASFAPNPVIPGSMVTMTVETSPAATPGSFPAPIQASSDAISHTLDTTIAVFPEAQPLWLPLLRVGD